MAGGRLRAGRGGRAPARLVERRRRVRVGRERRGVRGRAGRAGGVAGVGRGGHEDRGVRVEHAGRDQRAVRLHLPLQG